MPGGRRSPQARRGQPAPLTAQQQQPQQAYTTQMMVPPTAPYPGAMGGVFMAQGGWNGTSPMTFAPCTSGMLMPPQFLPSAMAGSIPSAVAMGQTQMGVAPTMSLVSSQQLPASASGVHQISVDQQEVLAAVETLYADELKPYGRILRKRLAERAQAASGMPNVDIDIRHLKSVCESSPWLYVQMEEGGDWSALLRTRQSIFTDVYSPQDLYPPELWAAAAEYFGSLDDADMVLPGGRYSCAQVLVGRQLGFLQGRSLGQVCHIVQLAISQKKLLGYLNGAVVPYSRSQSMVKERCAERGKPCTSSTAKGALASWDRVRACLQEIIGSMAPGAESIPLSNMKRLFRSRFHLELSETALGYPKLSELLQDSRLSDICTVRLQGHGYVVVPIRNRSQHQQYQQHQQHHQHHQQQVASGAPPPRRNPISIADSLDVADVRAAEPAQSAPPLAPPAPSPAVVAREDASGSKKGRRPRIELSLEDIATPLQGMPTPTLTPGAPGLDPPSPTTAAAFAAGTLLSMPFPPTPSPCSMRAKSLPKLLGAGRNRLLPWHVDDSSLTKGHAAVGAGKPKAPAVLHLEGHVTLAPPPPPVEPAPWEPPEAGTHAASGSWEGFHPLTPSTLGNMGFMVQNTFIHANLPPPTPLNGGGGGGSCCRSHSLPRNMGSDRSAVAMVCTPPR